MWCLSIKCCNTAFLVISLQFLHHAALLWMPHDYTESINLLTYFVFLFCSPVTCGNTGERYLTCGLFTKELAVFGMIIIYGQHRGHRGWGKIKKKKKIQFMRWNWIGYSPKGWMKWIKYKIIQWGLCLSFSCPTGKLPFFSLSTFILF